MACGADRQAGGSRKGARGGLEEAGGSVAGARGGGRGPRHGRCEELPGMHAPRAPRHRDRHPSRQALHHAPVRAPFAFVPSLVTCWDTGASSQPLMTLMPIACIPTVFVMRSQIKQSARWVRFAARDAAPPPGGLLRNFQDPDYGPRSNVHHRASLVPLLLNSVA